MRRPLKGNRPQRKFRELQVVCTFIFLSKNFKKKMVIGLITWFSEQDQKSCSCKSGSPLSLIHPNQANQAPLASLVNTAHANQAPLPSLINPSQANRANHSAWSILLRQTKEISENSSFNTYFFLLLSWWTSLMFRTSRGRICNPGCCRWWQVTDEIWQVTGDKWFIYIHFLCYATIGNTLEIKWNFQWIGP